MHVTIDIIEKYVKGKNNPNTRKAYRNSLKKFTIFLENNKITDLTQENIHIIIYDYKAYLNSKNYKPSYINHNLVILKEFINEYTELEYNKKLKLEKIIREPKYLREPQIKTALKYATDPLDKLMIRLLSNTGLRIQEALKITKKDLIKDTDEQENAIVKIIGKNTKKRHILIQSELKDQLLEYSKDNKIYVFESPINEYEPLNNRTIEYSFKKLAKKIDREEKTTLYSENLKPHNLRHSFAIRALKTNEINYVKEFLGHENITTTQIYTNLKKEEVIERFKDINLI